MKGPALTADNIKPIYRGTRVIVTDDGLFVDRHLHTIAEATQLRDESTGELRDELTQALKQYAIREQATDGGAHR